MGYDCTYHLPINTNIEEVEGFLQFFGFRRIRKGVFIFFEERDYLSVAGVYIKLEFKQDKSIDAYLRSQICASAIDIDIFNSTIKHFRKRFGGYFESDF